MPSINLHAPSILYRPDLYRANESEGIIDRWGNAFIPPNRKPWLAVYGSTPGCSGVFGWGATPAEAMADFDQKWFCK